MARLIVKSPYIKGSAAGGYLKYIGTREGVELLPAGYMEYMAERPRSHGLFGDEDHVDMDTVMKELNQYPGNIWTHIISLKREDAERLGYEHAAQWRNLIRAHRNEIAAAMNIPPGDFRWYAAFHDEGDHPHVHMMAWSVKPGQAYLNQKGIRKVKSELTNDIFQHEMQHIYEQKSASRDELVQEARRAMRRLTKQMQTSICDFPEVENLMQELAVQLETVKGKKSYGYLPKKLKPLVDKIVDSIEQLPTVHECYEQWWRLQCQVEDFYAVKERTRPPLSQQKEFRSIKNAVIQEAECIRLGTISFEDKGVQQEDEPDEYTDEQSQSVSELEQLAESGDAHAQYLMGKLWRDGPVLIPDSVNARYWFERAAMQGNVAAQYSLAKLLLSPDVEVQNVPEGLHWLETAAENGSHYAAYRLGKEYLRGKIVEKNADKAMDYFTQSAEAGNNSLNTLWASCTWESTIRSRPATGSPNQQPRETSMRSSSWTVGTTQNHPRSCCRSHGCSATWVKSSGTTPYHPKLRWDRRRIESCGSKSEKRKSPWAIKQMTMRSITVLQCPYEQIKDYLLLRFSLWTLDSFFGIVLLAKSQYLRRYHS